MSEEQKPTYHYDFEGPLTTRTADKIVSLLEQIRDNTAAILKINDEVSK